MKKYFLIFMFLVFCSSVNAQCVPELKGVEIDPIYGSVRVITQYVYNGQAVDVVGEPCDNCMYTSGRYDESQGTLEEILALNDSDVEQHCKNLIVKKLSIEKTVAIIAEKLEEKKKQNEDLKNEFEKKIGTKRTVTSIKEIYKTKEITLEADGSYTIIDVTP